MHLHVHLHILPLPHITPCRHSTSSKIGTPLHAAVLGGHLEIVRLLVGAGANVSKVSELFFHAMSTQLDTAIHLRLTHIEEFLRSVGGMTRTEAMHDGQKASISEEFE